MNQPTANSLDTRVGLAEDRTRMAWIRTTLTMATFGFGLVGLWSLLVR
jgi:uncharacterized membrane protein YidH (DUF202 family)